MKKLFIVLAVASLGFVACNNEGDKKTETPADSPAVVTPPADSPVVVPPTNDTLGKKDTNTAAPAK